MLMKRTLIGSGILTCIFFALAAWVYWGIEVQLTPSPTEEIVVEPVGPGNAPAALRIRVREDGIYTISEQVIEQAALPFSDFSADSLSLTRNGEQVAFYVDSSDEANELIYFYGEAITSTIESPSVYLLKSEPGLAMQTVDAQPTGVGQTKGFVTQHWEKNTTFLAQSSGGDVWLGDLIWAPAALDIPLEAIAPSGGSGTLYLELWSNNEATVDPDHHLKISLNGTLLRDEYWDGITRVSLEIAVPANLLTAEDNVLTLSAPGDTGAAGEAIYVDSIALNYESDLAIDKAPLRFTSGASNLSVGNASAETLVFDISNPRTPVRMMNAVESDGGITFSNSTLESSYIALNPTQLGQADLTVAPVWDTPLTDAAQGADYIAIVPNEVNFAAELQPLLDLRESQGLKTQFVSLSQVYDEFGHGRESVGAIRDFLNYTVDNWSIAPRYALLVGDASYDINHFVGGENRNLLPTHLVYTEYAGYVASDTWLATADETGLTPRLALGRFPVQTAEQLKVIVDKTIAYETAEAADWQTRSLLVADDESYFNRASDDLAEQLAKRGFENQKLYMTENEDIHDSIISALNQGVGILNYVGHGSVRVWGDERVFQVEDADTLTNGDQLPIFTTFTCLNGYFNHPQDSALAETLLWAENGGIVAAIAPSGRSLTSQQTPLAERFFDSLLTGEAATLGEALQIAKETGADDPYLAEVIHTFNLLGDPALRFHLPEQATQASQ